MKGSEAIGLGKYPTSVKLNKNLACDLINNCRDCALHIFAILHTDFFHVLTHHTCMLYKCTDSDSIKKLTKN